MHIGVVHIGVTDWNPPSLWLFTVKWIKALTAGNKICAAADCMRDSFHEYGKVYRIGGDEFAVIITENPSQVEELIHSFDSNVANWHGKFVDSMTVSYGWVFSTERNWDSAYEISKAADARMYQSKERYYTESGADRR